jgi:hypothetical protein
MYWPVGAPKIYAASNHELAPSAKRVDKPDDPADATEYADDDENNAGNGNPDAKESGSRSKKPRTSDPSSRSIDQLALRRDEHVGGEIIGVRLGRNGHLFATITRCTLTVWQTKVRRQDPSLAALTIIAHHGRCFCPAVGILNQVVR